MTDRVYHCGDRVRVTDMIVRITGQRVEVPKGTPGTVAGRHPTGGYPGRGYVVDFDSGPSLVCAADWLEPMNEGNEDG